MTSAETVSGSRERKRSITVAGHRTSVSLEGAFWDGLVEIAAARGLSTAALIAEIDASRRDCGLSSAIRLHVLDHFRTRRAAPSIDEGA